MGRPAGTVRVPKSHAANVAISRTSTGGAAFIIILGAASIAACSMTGLAASARGICSTFRNVQFGRLPGCNPLPGSAEASVRCTPFQSCPVACRISACCVKRTNPFSGSASNR